jgi:hypothetical protein
MIKMQVDISDAAGWSLDTGWAYSESDRRYSSIYGMFLSKK